MGDPSKLYQTLHFSSSSAIVDIGDSFQEPILSGAETNVTYTSSNIDVASVNATTGKVTIKDIGTTKITATAEATEEYNMGSTSYTLTVKPLEELYDFTNPEALGFTFPNTASREIIIDKDIIMGTVTMSVTHGSNTETRFYKNSNNEIYLGVYSGGDITFCVPNNYRIDQISFTPKKGEKLDG
jgi:Cu/Ag efflux protein CusF